jgi:hypothetical protein
MDIFNRDMLEALASSEQPISISIYMPAIRVEPDSRQNPIRFKNLLREVEQQMKSAGHRELEINKILEDAHALLKDDRYWINQSDGLAVFITPERTMTYRLPVTFKELARVGDRFHLKPLFPIIAANNRFYVLSLSQNDVKLFQGTNFGLSEVQSKEFPKSLKEALWADDPERQLQFHSALVAAPMRHDALHFGQGASGEDAKSRPKDSLFRFFQQINDGIMEELRYENAPMVLAGVEYYLPIYREVNNYQGLVQDDILAGNPEHIKINDLHQRAWQVIEPLFMESQATSREQFGLLFNTNGEKLASEDLTEIVPASVFHRIDTLFIEIGSNQWGRYDADENRIEIHDERENGDEDLIDLAAVNTFINGGTVHALRRENMPVDGKIAATFRYPGQMSAESAI